jgi:DNA invertase Pin-like site-specific DNA recombinase
MREYATRRGWLIALQVREIGSGASQRERREQLLEAARRRAIDVVLVWRLDRWGRSVTDLLATLQELKHLGVGFASLTEALDLTTPAGRAMAGLLAVFAEFEREILRVRFGDGRSTVKRAAVSKHVSYHTFRYTFGTLLNANGENAKVVKELLRQHEGHDRRLHAGGQSPETRGAEQTGEDGPGKTASQG